MHIWQAAARDVNHSFLNHTTAKASNDICKDEIQKIVTLEGEYSDCLPHKTLLLT